MLRKELKRLADIHDEFIQVSLFSSRNAFVRRIMPVFMPGLQEVLRISANTGALTLNAFADSASGIRGTVSNNLSHDRNARAGIFISFLCVFYVHDTA